MSRRRTAIYIIIAISLLAGLVTGRGFFFNVGYAFIGLLIFAYFWAWSGANWLRLTRQTRARRAQVGRYVEERFTVKNSGTLPKLWLEVYDHSSLPGHRASHVANNLGARSATSWTVRTLCVRRGEFLLGPLRVVAGDPFGLFEVERKISATSRLVVYPSTFSLPDFALPAGILPGGEALRRRTHQITTNAAGVRDYVPGDSMNRIHWRSTARKDRLIVKEFELDPLADIWIIMDAERTVQAGEYNPTDLDAERMPWETGAQFALPPATEEYAVAISASLGNYFVERDRALGFITEGQHREVIQPDRGARQLNKIFETLAVVRAVGRMPLDQLLLLECEPLTRGTTIVVVTSSTRDEWAGAAHRLLRRGLRVIGVLIDPEDFGGRPGMRQIGRRLSAVGIPAYVIHKGENLSAALGHQIR